MACLRAPEVAFFLLAVEWGSEDGAVVAEAIRDLPFMVGAGLVKRGPASCSECRRCFFEGVEFEALEACMFLSLHGPNLDLFPISLNRGLISL